MNDQIKKQLTTTGIHDTRAIVRPSFDSQSGFELLKSMARAMSACKLVPEDYQGNSPDALANCCHAISMAAKLGLEPITVAQNLHTISGQSVWSAKFRVAAINSCGIWEPPLRYQIDRDSEKKSVEYTAWKYDKREGKRVPIKQQRVIQNMRCRAYAVNRATGEIDYGPEVSVELAVREGWYDRPGSKWQTMPENMLMKRAASWFGDTYAPHVTMGLGTTDDALDAEYSVAEPMPEAEPEPAPEAIPGVEVSAEAETLPEPQPAPKKRGRPKKTVAPESTEARNFESDFRDKPKPLVSKEPAATVPDREPVVETNAEPPAPPIDDAQYSFE